MSDIDLSKAIAPRDWDVAVWASDGNYVTGCTDVADRKRLVGLIERQVREQVAREIVTEVKRRLLCGGPMTSGMEAADIARGTP